MMIVVDSAGVIKDNVASLINFNYVIELGINNQVDGFIQGLRKMHVQSQVATLHETKVSAHGQVWTQIKRKQCVPSGVVITR